MSRKKKIRPTLNPDLSEFINIPGYEELYKIAKDGRVWDCTKKKWEKICIHPRGYCRVYLKKDNKQRQLSLHRLIMLSFIGPSDFQVNHKNGVKTDNNLDNLEYCNNSQNQLHSYIHGLNWKTGEKHESAKLTTEQVIKIRDIFRADNTKTFVATAKEYGVAPGTISDIVNYKTWKHI